MNLRTLYFKFKRFFAYRIIVLSVIDFLFPFVSDVYKRRIDDEICHRLDSGKTVIVESDYGYRELIYKEQELE